MARQVITGVGSGSTYNKNSYENTHIFDKTRLCKFYAKGKCKRGQACTFAHGESQVQPQPDFFRTQLCADFVRSGVCKSGSGCGYAHSPHELRRAKTHKSSGSSGSSNTRGQGLRKAADPQVSLEVQKLEMMQQEVARLRSQLLTLQGITGCPLPGPACASVSSAPLTALKASTGRSFKVVDEEDLEADDDWLDAPEGFSRQSTEEGSEPPGCFSRQSTVEECDTWDDFASAPCSLDEEHRLQVDEEEEEEEIACELFVKRTFISLEPVKAISHRRAASTPATRRLGVV